MPSRQDDDNYQYDADTINSLGFERYRFYEKGDEGWLEIIDTETGRSVQFKDGKIRSDALDGIYIAREEDGDDIFDAVNKALAETGSDSTIFVEPHDYRADEYSDVSTKLETQAEGQVIDFLGSDVKVADGVSFTEAVHLRHDSCTLQNIVIDGNRQNNDHNRVVFVDASLDTRIDNYEFLNVEKALSVENSRLCAFMDLQTNQDTVDSAEFIEVRDSENMSIRDAHFTGFERHGIHLANCEDILVDGCVVTTDPNGQSVADTGLFVEGTIQSKFAIAVESFGDVTDGILARPYDIGGADQRSPTQNRYDIKVEGARDIGIHLEDCDAEIVRGFVDGDTDGNGRTSQAFLVDSPNAIDDTPAHNMVIDAQKCDRLTDTQIPSNNAGMRIAGHYQQMQSTTTLQNNGTGTFEPHFGPAMPNPAFNVLAQTSLDAKIDADRPTTDSNGQFTVDWSDFFAFDDKPILTVQLEQAGQWYVASYTTDTNGRYTGATIQVTDSSGTAVGSGRAAVVKLVGV